MQQTFIIGGREFTCSPMNAFAANTILLRLQKIAVPLIGAIASSGKSENLMDMDVKEAAAMLSEHLNESVFKDIVMPMFNEAKVFSCENKKFLKASVDIDQCFTVENLFDLYELIFEVGRFQFSPFFATLASRFGSLTGGNGTKALSQAS